MSKLREQFDNLRRWVRGETGEKPGMYFDDIAESALDLLDEMAASLEPNGHPPGPEFLEWIAARLVIHGDSEHVDFVQALKRKAAKQRTALAKYECKPIGDDHG